MKCRNCGSIKGPMFSCRRQGGGSYNRAGRSYSSTICGQCALSYATIAANPRGSSSHANWDLHGLLSAARGMGWQGPRNSFNGRNR